MDNASKALVIAGAILLAVMLVSFVVMVYNTATGTAENSLGSISALGVSAYNAQFEQSFGGNRTKSQVSSLISKVIANNGDDNNPDIYVRVSGDSTGSDNLTTIAGYKKSIDTSSNTARFTVSGAYGEDGTLAAIVIE